MSGGQPVAATPTQVVGVLLPLRIETRFDPGRLRLRVVPDEPWYARHDPRVTEGELAALARYLNADAAAPDDANRGQAWRELAAHVGGPRAVFLLRAYVAPGPAGQPAVRAVDPSELRTDPAFPRIEGFPNELRVWLARGGGAPALVETLTIDQAKLRADFPDPEAPDDRRWWEDWDEAVKAGLATEIPLAGNPNDIDALYVTGLGSAHPAALLESHRDEGRLGLLAPGTPTNSVDGAPAAALGSDPATWLAVLREAAGESDQLVSRALTGDPALLGNLPGADEPQQRWAVAIVRALWPALWGFAGADVWALPATADAAAWAARALHPEGPFPTLRVGAQPYGLLPATAVARWQPAPGDPPVEAAMLPALLHLRGRWRDAAEARGTTAGAGTDRLLDLLAQMPTSPGYRHRHAWPLELWWLALLLLGYSTTWTDLDAGWHTSYRLAQTLGLDPARRYGTRAAPRRLSIPLILPPDLPPGETLPRILKRLVDTTRTRPDAYARTDVLEREFLRFRADSLLLRLVIRSLQVTLGDIGREAAGEAPPGPEPVARPDGLPGRLESWIARLTPQALAAGTPACTVFSETAAAILQLGRIPLERLERLLRATVDTATYRIDPWLVGPPTRRLQDLLDAGQAGLALGAYGWVDMPRPGTPGPTAAGLLHAPSPAQALTATVLRDRAVADPEAARWELDLTSATVRAADRLAEHVRTGAHLAEAVGREIERIVAARTDVERLRRDHPLRAEHAGRRVCDGLAILEASVTDPASLGLTAGQLSALAPLRAALDAYGDLLVAEAVHHVIERRAEVAGAVMDAAAGLSRPPHLALLRTPREGRAVQTSVVLLLPTVAEPALPAAGTLERAEVSPATLADAAAAAFLTDQLGAAADWAWEVALLDADGQPTATTATVTLADLGLGPADALALARTDLERLIAAAGAASLGADSGPAATAVALIAADGSARYERAARLATLLGRAPVGPDAVTERADTVVDPATVDADLRRRYGLVHATAAELVRALTDELAQAGADGGIGAADPAVLTRLVAAARAWGVAPDPPPPPDTAGGSGTSAQPDPEELAERRLVATAARALELLHARADAAPTVATAAALARDDLIAALVALATPTGQLAVTSRLLRGDLPALEPAGPGDSSLPLDQTWLPPVAAVRQPLARVEVHQLAADTTHGGGPALLPLSTKPDDPWQADADDGRRLVVAYVAASLDLATLPAGAQVAAAAVDRWAEVVPAAGQTTATAFGFDAPGARAPQAILLAVPPDLAAPLDAQTLLDIVADTRELAHARMARPADLDPEARGLLPAVLLPATGPTATPIDPSERS